jgi:hypothetical protein
MPIEDLFGLPDGYQVRSDFRGRSYVLLEVKDRSLIIAEFSSRPRLDKCLEEIAAWETLRANVRGEKK